MKNHFKQAREVTLDEVNWLAKEETSNRKKNANVHSSLIGIKWLKNVWGSTNT